MYLIFLFGLNVDRGCEESGKGQADRSGISAEQLTSCTASSTFHDICRAVVGDEFAVANESASKEQSATAIHQPQ